MREVECGRWSVGGGVREVECGRWSAGGGVREVECGRWSAGGGMWLCDMAYEIVRWPSVGTLGVDTRK